MNDLKDRLASLTPEQLARLKSQLASAKPRTPSNGKPLEFTLFFFSADGTSGSDHKYDLLLRCAEFGDAHGFRAIWTPERHFSPFGGLYPNPAVLGAALAARTSRIEIRAGSVVLPLHNPIRIAEEWSVVDNLSNGRVAMAFASGWHKTDFALRPEAYAARRDAMGSGIETVRRLWRGERVGLPGVDGETVEIVTYPRPIQPELRYWLTCSSPTGWEKAGEIGANVLCMLGPSVSKLGQNIAAYRQARAAAGHAAEGGTVSVMLHTYVDNDRKRAKEKVRGPLKGYLEDYIRQYDVMVDETIQKDVLANKDAFLEFAFERYFEQASLLGPQDKCQRLLNELSEIGVNEIACLVDFGVETDDVLDSLSLLEALHYRHASPQGLDTATADTTVQKETT
ncbi:MupA/Atu3671 family FMN-dependent luciferase-like monooxygenase [Caldimonas brevitalea]|uniref:Non-ribosomal peptide synthetase n=1 Tax=Caldimonas brevitalea TaxID=413882 RepID=A0A0G3BNB5_9BURK|nr:MupA/Atu3671 family FMN-dependent luciferase-like monooxygenase [Caldimonas brevitalea]AKJ30944.1 non-ribosomal peptide synthetase [Caldimonas brevitalea]